MLLSVIIIIVAGYLLGNVNGAVMISKLVSKEDIRNSGSGNAGLTNFLRKFGPSVGIWVIVIDMGKAFAACLTLYAYKNTKHPRGCIGKE